MRFTKNYAKSVWKKNLETGEETTNQYEETYHEMLELEFMQELDRKNTFLEDSSIS